MTIQPINGFILVKQLKKWTKDMFGEESEVLPNEFEVISVSQNEVIESWRVYPNVWDIIIKWIHSGDLITVDGEEFFIIKPENILWIKTN